MINHHVSCRAALPSDQEQLYRFYREPWHRSNRDPGVIAPTVWLPVGMWTTMESVDQTLGPQSAEQPQ